MIQVRKKGKDQESIQSSIWESDTNARKHLTQESKESSPFPAGGHKAIRNKQDSVTKTNTKHKRQKNQQKNHCLRTVSKKITGGL